MASAKRPTHVVRRRGKEAVLERLCFGCQCRHHVSLDEGLALFDQSAGLLALLLDVQMRLAGLERRIGIVGFLYLLMGAQGFDMRFASADLTGCPDFDCEGTLFLPMAPLPD